MNYSDSKGSSYGIIRNTAHVCHGRTIASSLQLEAFGMDVNDKALSLGGKQHIVTPDGYIIPLSTRLPEDSTFHAVRVGESAARLPDWSRTLVSIAIRP